jgi:hypothetical protein
MGKLSGDKYKAGWSGRLGLREFELSKLRIHEFGIPDGPTPGYASYPERSFRRNEELHDYDTSTQLRDWWLLRIASQILISRSPSANVG